jgi:sucrose-phosphate synthase
MTQDNGLYFVLISVHGLIRGEDPELGRDADTGGQVQYALELARALSRHPRVGRVELFTRQVLSTRLDYRYGEPLEQIADTAWIVRLPCGPHRYLHKESLWPYLPQFVGHALQRIRESGRIPDVLHSHYADAGSVGVRLSKLLDVPLVHTGHSLGRIKQQRLLDQGMAPEAIENRFNMTRRISAEESVLEHADLIVASTGQEVTEQYADYQAATRKRMAVIPPGVNLDRFRPPQRGERFAVSEMIDRFLMTPKKPMILAIQRPDERKNLAALIDAYGSSDRLREAANLVLLIGNREDIAELPHAQKRILTEMLLEIDRHDLYGLVAYPKQHSGDDVPEFYRLAASRRGVFVNPALTEPFGLTLIEAAASGLPIVAPDDGGPKAIVEECRNGVLIDPLDRESITQGLVEMLSDRQEWRRRSRSGIRGANRTYSWDGHVARYMRHVKTVLRRRQRSSRKAPPPRMVTADLLVIADIDNTLIGNREALAEFLAWLSEHRERVAFGVATGRVPKSTLKVLEERQVPSPEVMISSVGSEIFYCRSKLVEDIEWRLHIDHDWNPGELREALDDLPGLELQPVADQRPFKLSYFVEPDRWTGVRDIRRHLKERQLDASLIYSHESYLDLLPVRASKGNAVKFITEKWGFHPENTLVAGDSGNDADMLRSGVRAVVVGNYSRELSSLKNRQGIYFADATHARGILEGIAHFGLVPPPEDADTE